MEKKLKDVFIIILTTLFTNNLIAKNNDNFETFKVTWFQVRSATRFKDS